MRRVLSCFASFSLLIALTTASLHAGPAFTDAEKAGVDFQLQGEYSGDLGSGDDAEKFGVQIIAQGKGKFRVVGYHGGLPGDGWNGEDPIRVEGEFAVAADSSIKLEDSHGVALLQNGQLVVDLGKDGSTDGTLKKVLRKSPTLGKKPPAGAAVLFNGSTEGTDNWQNGQVDEEGYLMPGVNSKQRFGNHHLHVEFRIPFMPEDRGQGRGNSGCYLQGRYEAQMLDSFGLEGKMNECGGVYSVADCPINMCFPPLSWQTYDIDFTAAQYDNGKLIANPKMTVRLNGVVIHEDLELPGDRNTPAGPLQAGPEPGPVHLQNHGNPVRYRNIWVVEK